VAVLVRPTVDESESLSTPCRPRISAESGADETSSGFSWSSFTTSRLNKRDSERALYLPTDAGYVILKDPARGSALLTHLKEIANGH